MKNSALFLCFTFVSLVCSQYLGGETVFSVVDTITFSQPTFYGPQYNTNTGTCTTLGIYDNYIIVNTTITNSGLLEVDVEESVTQSVSLYIYKDAFFPNTPCVGYVNQTFRPQSRNHIPLFFTQGTYFFVIGYDPPSPYPSSGIFSVSLRNSTASGQPFQLQSWLPPVITNGKCSNSAANVGGPYALYSWTQTLPSGAYDLRVIFDTASSVVGTPAIALYSGVVDIFDTYFVQHSCNATATGSYLLASNVASNDEVSLFEVDLVAGQTYSAAFSTYQTSNYIFQILSSSRYVKPQPTTVQVPAYGFPCSPGSTCYYDAYLFTAQSQISGVVVGDSILTYVSIYQGNNVGNSTNGPQTCTNLLVSQSLSSQQLALFVTTTPGTEYTAVVANNCGSTYYYNSTAYLFADFPSLATLPQQPITISFVNTNVNNSKINMQTTYSSTGCASSDDVVSITWGAECAAVACYSGKTVDCVDVFPTSPPAGMVITISYQNDGLCHGTPHQAQAYPLNKCIPNGSSKLLVTLSSDNTVTFSSGSTCDQLTAYKSTTNGECNFDMLTIADTAYATTSPSVTSSAGATVSGTTAAGATATGTTASAATATGATASGATVSGATASDATVSGTTSASTTSSPATTSEATATTTAAYNITYAVVVLVLYALLM